MKVGAAVVAGARALARTDVIRYRAAALDIRSDSTALHGAIAFGRAHS